MNILDDKAETLTDSGSALCKSSSQAQLTLDPPDFAQSGESQIWLTQHQQAINFSGAESPDPFAKAAYNNC